MHQQNNTTNKLLLKKIIPFLGKGCFVPTILQLIRASIKMAI
jgi:hypothetical protein